MSALTAEGLALAARAEVLRLRGALPVYNRGALAAWHAALANRATAPAKVVWLGDSVTEGYSAGAYGARWVDRALAALRSAYPTAGVTGGVNFLPPYAAGGAPQPYQSVTGTIGSDGSRGLAGRCSIFNSDGAGVTYSVAATSVSVIYDKAPGLGTIALSVDGGAAVTASAVGTNGTSGVLSSGPLAAGTHTVSVTRSGAGAVYFSGLMVFNGDEAAGVQGYEGGHWGWSSANFATSANYFWAVLGQIAPQLVTLAVGTNDYAAQVSAATFKANLQAAIAGIRTVAPAASIALICYSRRGDVAAQPVGWSAYVQAAYEAADADIGGLNGRSGVAVVDLSARLPDAAMTGAADLIGAFHTDRVHYTAKGHAMTGEMVAGALRA